MDIVDLIYLYCIWITQPHNFLNFSVSRIIFILHVKAQYRLLCPTHKSGRFTRVKKFVYTKGIANQKP